MNRRSFLSRLVLTCAAVTTAGRMTFQPELKEEHLNRFEQLQIIVDEMNFLAEETMGMSFQDALSNMAYNFAIYGVCTAEPKKDIHGVLVEPNPSLPIPKNLVQLKIP